MNTGCSPRRNPQAHVHTHIAIELLGLTGVLKQVIKKLKRMEFSPCPISSLFVTGLGSSAKDKVLLSTFTDQRVFRSLLCSRDWTGHGGYSGKGPGLFPSGSLWAK